MTKEGRLRLKPAAKRLGVHHYTLREWAREGMITYYAIGKGQYMEFDIKDLDALDLSFRRGRPDPVA